MTKTTTRPMQRQFEAVGLKLPADVRGMAGFILPFYRDAKKTAEHRAAREALPIRCWDDENEPTRFWTRADVEWQLNARCECTTCVVFGGDCPASLRAELEAPRWERILRGMRRAENRI